MKKYVDFECHHMAESEKKFNERGAFAYADIDGYTEDENEEGIVICRVWLTNNKSYIVNWNYNEYRMNKQVLELIEEAKANLISFFYDVIEAKVFGDAYARYQLRWMISHNHTIDELIDLIGTKLKNTDYVVHYAYHLIKSESGFNGEIWDSEDQFRSNEWQDKAYMQELLTDEEYEIWVNRKRE